MRVLVLTNMLPLPERPWYGTFVREQVEDIRGLGVDVAVRFVNGAESRANYLREVPRLRKTLGERSVDLVHAHYGLTGAVAVSQRRVPVVTTFHGSDCNGDRRWERAVSWAVARLSTPIVVASELAVSLGLPAAAVIPAAVDLDLFRPMARSEARRALGWADDGVVALLPGSRGDPAKGADLFDSALVQAQIVVPELRGASLEGLTREQVMLTMNAADVVLMTSRSEGSPVAVKESLACLTPVVSVPVGDVGTLLGGLSGCSVVPRDPSKLGDALLAALDAGRPPELRERVASYGRAQLAAQIVDVYRGVLSATES